MTRLIESLRTNQPQNTIELKDWCIKENKLNAKQTYIERVEYASAVVLLHSTYCAQTVFVAIYVSHFAVSKVCFAVSIGNLYTCRFAVPNGMIFNSHKHSIFLIILILFFCNHRIHGFIGFGLMDLTRP